MPGNCWIPSAVFVGIGVLAPMIPNTPIQKSNVKFDGNKIAKEKSNQQAFVSHNRPLYHRQQSAQNSSLQPNTPSYMLHVMLEVKLHL